MPLNKVLIANRGEIAIRIARAATDCGIETLAIHSKDDARSLHVRAADSAVELEGAGVAAYLDGEAIIRIARETGCDAIHPGYGLLSENADFAAQCAEAGLIFVGPKPATLETLGDKLKARALAQDLGIPVIEGSADAADPEAARAFFATLGGAPMIMKAVAGGGGRGMRIIRKADEIDTAFAQCAAEAENAFGSGAIYVERYLPAVRHVEVQIVGDGAAVTHLWERECTVQRRNQKLIEIAPAPKLDPAVRGKILEAAMRLASACNYESLGTFEFLVDAESAGEPAFYFIEANPRLQVEHTVTEEVTGIDLVQTQFRLAAGGSLGDLGMSKDEPPRPNGYAIQLRINMETITADGTVRPAGGTLSLFEPPTGPGIRVDSYGYAGYQTNPNFDSLLAKLIVHSRSDELGSLIRKAGRALDDFRIDGVTTNAAFLNAILAHEAGQAWRFTTRFIDDHLPDLLKAEQARGGDAFFETAGAAAKAQEAVAAPPGTEAVPAPLQGLVVSIEVEPGERVRKGQQVAILEAMKMQHVVSAPQGGIVHSLCAAPGDVPHEGHPVLFIQPLEDEDVEAVAAGEVDLDAIRPDLREILDRIHGALDEGRPEATAKRHSKGLLTARENVDLICDDGTFIEYGQFALAAQRRRRAYDDLVKSTPGDGMVAGVGAVNGDLFDEQTSRTAVLAYDYTVLAGTQGYFNHRKTDRVLETAEKWRLPVIFYTEGGGGRPGDTDVGDISATGLDVPTFATFARLSGLVPRIGIANGRCFAGNAALFGCSDITIATRNSWIGMGGPAMIEGGGLGVYKPEDIGPIDVQYPNGVVDLVADDETHAAQLAKQVLSYFQGPITDWSCADQRLLRSAIPENRKRVYEIRNVIDALADTGSVLELRRPYGRGMITAFVRIEGRPFGLIANDPMHLGGAIDAEAAEKAARFLQLCDAFDLPILSLCDTPGFMVGPDSEEEAAVRRVSRMFVVGATIDVPLFMVVLRKGYGLGAQAMAGGSFLEPFFNISWPTGEFGGMGLEGAVRLGYAKELAAQETEEERQALFDKLVARSYEHGKAISVASLLELDAVIDPADTRAWLMNGISSIPAVEKRTGKKRPFVDTW